MDTVKLKKFFSIPVIMFLSAALFFLAGYFCFWYMEDGIFVIDPALCFSVLSFVIAFVALICAIIHLIRNKKTKFNVIRNIAVILLSLAILFFSYFMAVFSLFSPTLPFQKEDKKITSQQLNVNLDKGKYLKRKNKYGGFLNGDGYYFSIMQFKDEDDISDDLKNNPEWNELPMPSELKLSLGMEVDGKKLDLEYREEDGVIIPDVQNGFYFFRNRQNEANPKDINAVSRMPWNYTAAVYDSDTHTLYFFEIDT